MQFVDSWVPRVSEPARSPKEKKSPEGCGDCTGRDKALEALKSAEVDKEDQTDPAEKERGAGQRTRREQQRKCG